LLLPKRSIGKGVPPPKKGNRGLLPSHKFKKLLSGHWSRNLSRYIPDLIEKKCKNKTEDRGLR